MVNVGVIGCGHWGNNYLRLTSSMPGVRLVACADVSEDRLKAVRQAYPNVAASSDCMSVVRQKDVQAVLIATPTATHHALAKEALECGKDVLCEKPLTTSVEQAEELVALAKKTGQVLMVGHIFVYNPGIQKLYEYTKSGMYGRIYYMDSVRTNLGPFRRDVNVVWDLAPHDVSIFSYLLGAHPLRVWAKGVSFLQPGIEDVAFISLMYPGQVLGHIHVSWLDPRKVRQITIVGDKKMVSWDDLDNVGPIKVYDKSVVRERYYDNFGEFFLLAREGDITIPKVTLAEPLKAELSHFIECVMKRKTPITDGMNGLQVVKVLAAVQKSIEQDGVPQEVKV
ncbi:MAG: Gfo/Idh/MocA family oxidoreductase [Planctomycetes bacterium]|nr:Gfo/Idh/MocA family oxidoreductase [Planctomycetota bacterium]